MIMHSGINKSMHAGSGGDKFNENKYYISCIFRMWPWLMTVVGRQSEGGKTHYPDRPLFHVALRRQERVFATPLVNRLTFKTM